MAKGVKQWFLGEAMYQIQQCHDGYYEKRLGGMDQGIDKAVGKIIEKGFAGVVVALWRKGEKGGFGPKRSRMEVAIKRLVS
jgi:hypothetical protein